MPFQVSPGIVVTERDLTTVVPNVATSIGAMAGAFQWGPVMERITVTTENDLVRIFGEPKGKPQVIESFYVASNYLAYTNNLIVVRNVSDDARNSVVGDDDAASATAGTVVHNVEDYDSDIASLAGTDVLFLGKYPGKLGNSLKAHAIDKHGWNATGLTGEDADIQTIFKAAFDRAPGTSNDVAKANGWDGVTTDVLGITIAAGDYPVGTEITQTRTPAVGDVTTIKGKVTGKPAGHLSAEDYIPYKPTTASAFKPTGTVTENGISVVYSTVTDGTNAKTVTSVTHDEPYTLNNDEMHVIVIDEDGLFTGEPGEVLERHAHVSKAEDAKKIDGSTNYVGNVLRTQSQYIWLGDPKELDITSSKVSGGTPMAGYVHAGADKAGSVFLPMDGTAKIPGGSLTQGVDDNELSEGELIDGYELFKEPEVVDVTLVLGGCGNTTVSRWIIDNITSVRKDCIALVSPNKASVVNPASNSAAVAALEADNTALGSSSYAVMDGAWKYQYDRYNDVFRYIPMNGDIGGLCARTDFTHDAWWSPAGYNRGTIKNIVKLSWEANKANRDVMYQIGINPLITPRGAGVLLFGDKTMQVIPSAFDRINVRRLFIVLEKAISIAAKSLLFEFNDEFTRAQFVNLVSPFLRDVQGRRGITDFKVVCDESNNTGQVIDTNNFVGDIYIKPNRSINFIQLNFIAARTDVSFSEIGG